MRGGLIKKYLDPEVGKEKLKEEIVNFMKTSSPNDKLRIKDVSGVLITMCQADSVHPRGIIARLGYPWKPQKLTILSKWELKYYRDMINNPIWDVLLDIIAELQPEFKDMNNPSTIPENQARTMTNTYFPNTQPWGHWRKKKKTEETSEKSVDENKSEV
jgi:hypothetical protein